MKAINVKRKHHCVMSRGCACYTEGTISTQSSLFHFLWDVKWSVAAELEWPELFNVNICSAINQCIFPLTIVSLSEYISCNFPQKATKLCQMSQFPAITVKISLPARKYKLLLHAFEHKAKRHAKNYLKHFWWCLSWAELRDYQLRMMRFHMPHSYWVSVVLLSAKENNLVLNWRWTLTNDICHTLRIKQRLQDALTC